MDEKKLTGFQKAMRQARESEYELGNAEDQQQIPRSRYRLMRMLERREVLFSEKNQKPVSNFNYLIRLLIFLGFLLLLSKR